MNFYAPKRIGPLILTCLLSSGGAWAMDDIEELPATDIEIMKRNKIELDYEGITILGVKVYRGSQQNVLMAYPDNVSIKHGKGKSSNDNFGVLSQSPEDAEINGEPFFDYITSSTDHSDSSPARIYSGKLSVCWFSDENYMYEIPEDTAKNHWGAIDYNNHCLNDTMARIYWSKRDR